MYVSKNVILALLLAGAGLVGWASQSLFAKLGEPVAAAAVAAAPEATTNPAAPAEMPVQGVSGTEPVIAADAAAGDDNVYMTIVNSAGGTETGQSAEAIATATSTTTSVQTARAIQAVARVPAAGPSGTTGTRPATAPVGSCGNAGQPHVCVNGNNITIATNGAVVMIGDEGRLNASTGATSASGTVAIDAQGSTLKSGSSTVSMSTETAAAATSPTAANASPTVIPPHSNGSLDSMLVGLGGAGTSVSIAGFEDHSVSVLGNDHLVTYDDSNVFVNRNGQVNANTGDTDSSGLNVVDAIDSVVRSGNSGDGEGGDDAEEPEDADEGSPVGLPAAGGDASVDPDGDPDDSQPDADEPVSVAASRSMVGTTSTSASPFAASAGVDDEDVATTANGTNAFVIGADGFDDVSIRVWGDRDIVTYDDSNVVLGGTGNVNAQIGDSDTGGAVVMGVRNSYIQAGCEGDLCYSGQTP